MALAWPAIVALLAGIGIIAIGAVPYLAVQYRRRGGIGFVAAAMAAAAIVYACAVMAYTLLPLPDPAVVCRAGGVQPQLHLLAFVRDISREGGITGPASLLQNPAAAQVLFNVALFLPLGVLVRHRLRRSRFGLGVVAATGAGFAVSLMVETTQLTGDWFLYPCAYRLFDVDDLLANTSGALLGALLSPVLSALPDGAGGPAGTVRPVTAPRRLMGMGSDALMVLLAQAALTATVTAIPYLSGHRHTPGWVEPATYAAAVLPAAAQLVLVLLTGRTLGEAVVRLRPERRPGPLAGALRWLFGIGGWSVLGSFPGWESLSGSLLTATVIGVFLTRNRRGLAYALARLDVQDDRVDAPGSLRAAGEGVGDRPRVKP